jgi:hypothetical protein
MRRIWDCLRRNPWFAFITAGFLVTGIGTGLTQVAVFANLDRLGATPLNFAVAFAASVLPILISGEIGKSLVSRFDSFHVLIGVEVVGAISLLIPAIGIYSQSLSLLQAAPIFPALTAGLGVPAYSKIVKANAKAEDYTATAATESIAYAVNVMAGAGVGAIFYLVTPPLLYLGIDLASFIAAAVLIRSSQKRVPKMAAAAKSETVTGRTLGTRHGLAVPLLINAALALVTTPALALLPAVAQHFEASRVGLTFSISTVVVLIFARSLGQIIGPLLTTDAIINRFLTARWTMLLPAAGYLVLYVMVATTSNFLAAFVLVVAAHICSNLVFTTAQVAILRSFSKERIADASALSMQLQVLVMSALSIVTGLAAERASAQVVLIGFGLPAIGICALLTWNARALPAETIGDNP